MGRLDNKIAVITGANSGIGLASAKRFAQEGGRVFMTGRRQRELDTAVAEVRNGARGVRGDIANLADLDRLYEVVRAEAGHIDVLFANAGGGKFASLSEITEEDYESTLAAMNHSPFPQHSTSQSSASFQLQRTAIIGSRCI